VSFVIYKHKKQNIKSMAWNCDTCVYPGRKDHDWEYVGTEIHIGYKGSVKYKRM
jgi:hypothetical protein